MKKINEKTRLIVFVLSILSVGLFIFNNAQAMIDDENITNSNQYASGELIVKLKQGKTLEDIKELNVKYNVTSLEKVFEDLISSKDILKQFKDKLSSLDIGHQSWYWQLDKTSQEYKDYLDKLEKEKQDLEEQIKAQEDKIAYLENIQGDGSDDLAVSSLANIFTLKTRSDTDILAMAEDYAANLNVEYAEPNYIAKIQMIPNDPYYSSMKSWGQGYDDLWGLKKIQCGEAWNISQGQGVIVAVIDTGIDYNHEDLWDNVWVNPAVVSDANKDGKINLDDCDINHNHTIETNEIKNNMFGWDFANKDNDPMDGYGHGSHVAGTIAAVGNNNLGVIGVAPKAKIMALKGLDDNGSGYISDLANCIKYAADNKAAVLNNSWGGLGMSYLIRDAVNYAYSKKCVILAAAGNSNLDVKDFYPANIVNVIAVSASTQKDEKCSFSNWGDKIDVAAPGGGYENELGHGSIDMYNILSSMSDKSNIAYSSPAFKVSKNYYRLAGTSMACPHAAGVVSLILSKNPNLSNEDARLILRNCVDDLVKSNVYFGRGRINAYKAISEQIASASPTNLTASFASTNEVNLKWQDNSNNEAGFKIERSLDNSVFTQIAYTDHNVAKYSDILSNPATKYYYRVRAFNIAGSSGYSNIASAIPVVKRVSVSGTVYELNRFNKIVPLAGAIVILQGSILQEGTRQFITKNETTAANGSYKFNDIFTGMYTVYASKPGYSRFFPPRSMELKDSRSNITFYLISYSGRK